MKHRSFSPTIIVPIVSLAIAACSSAPSEETASSSDSAYTTNDFPRSCALGDDAAHGAVWVNYRAEAIGCGQNNPVGDALSNAYGATVRGRILCGIQWLQANQPSVFGRMGSVINQDNPDGVSGERHFVDGTREGEAWVTDFTSGSRVQFQWNGPCGADDNGYLKLYYKPAPDTGALPPLPASLKGCGFQQTSRIPPGDTNGHDTFASDNCGVSVDQWYWGNLASNMTMTLRYGGQEVRVETERRARGGAVRYVPTRWDSVVGDSARTYAYALGALQNASWVVAANGGNGDACLGAVAGLGAGGLGLLKSCSVGPVACGVDLLWTLSGLFNTAASC